MRHGNPILLTTILTVCVLAGCAMMCGCSEDSSAFVIGDKNDDPADPSPPEEITIYGYVSNVSDNMNNVPLPGVIVNLLDEDQLPLEGYEVITGEDGRFEFTYTEGLGVYLKFEYPGYKIKTVPTSLTDIGNNVLRMNLTDYLKDEEGRYRLSGEGDSSSPIAMSKTTIPLTGTVYGVNDDKETPLTGATVTATSKFTGASYATQTGTDGTFILNLPYDDYTIVATCNGFYDSAEIVIDVSESLPITIELEQKNFGNGFIGNLDLNHSIMILGVILITIAILIGLAMAVKVKDDGEFTVKYDLGEYEELEDELNP